MCWEYEESYGHCFDLIFKDVFYADENGLYEILRCWGVEVKEEDSFKEMFYDFLSRCHENSVIGKHTRKEPSFFGDNSVEIARSYMKKAVMCSDWEILDKCVALLQDKIKEVRSQEEPIDAMRRKKRAVAANSDIRYNIYNNIYLGIKDSIEKELNNERDM